MEAAMNTSIRSWRPSMRACAALALAGALSVVHAQTPPRPPIVKEGITVKISEHVWVIPDEKVPMVPNVGIVVGSRATLVVDPGMGLKSGRAVLNEVSKVSRNSELYILNTHFHPEHTTGEAAFSASTKIFRPAAQQQDVDEMGMKWVNIFRSRSPMIADVLKGITSFRAPDETFELEKIIDLGSVRVRMVWLGPGHTRGDSIIVVEGEGVMFSGDLAMKQLYPAFATPQSSARNWLVALDRMDTYKATKLVPSHGEMADASIIGAYRDYLKALQARTTELKREGKSVDETSKALTSEFSAKYRDWDQPARIAGAVAVMYAE
jgi:glyoxylase-like metal-dependent hydrolase (beta-lactamase superfamily II)